MIKVHSFPIGTSMQRLCARFHFGTKQTIEFFWVLATPAQAINKTRLNLMQGLHLKVLSLKFWYLEQV